MHGIANDLVMFVFPHPPLQAPSPRWAEGIDTILREKRFKFNEIRYDIGKGSDNPYGRRMKSELGRLPPSGGKVPEELGEYKHSKSFAILHLDSPIRPLGTFSPMGESVLIHFRRRRPHGLSEHFISTFESV